MMRYILVAGIAMLSGFVHSQNPLFIPDTIAGPNINLVMHHDSVQIFPGNMSHTYAYNSNSYLGPTLIFEKGTDISITVNNQIDDTTTVHWHGIHVPSVWDGGPHTPILQNTTWNPQFTVMDHAATYWYHPHLHKKTALQAIKGAAGLIIVRDSLESTLVLPRKYGTDDFPLIVQCQQYDSLNQAMPLGMQDSTLMVNGTLDPFLDAPAQVVRMRLLNASGERVFNFGFTGNMQFYQIGTDGGLLNAPNLTTRIRLAPGERAEILLNLSGLIGQSFYLMCYGSELPMGIQGGPTMPMPPGSPPMDSPLNGVDYNIMLINVTAQTSNAVLTIPASLANNIPYSESQADANRTIRFTADSLMVMDGPFYFNDSTFDMMRIDYTIPLDNIEIWKLVNETMVAHPFHIHDVQFFILDRNNIPPGPEEMGRKDVVLVPPGDSVRFITQFSDFVDTMIPYMYHCHILMHEDAGMMGQFIVTNATTGFSPTLISDDILSIYPNPADQFITIEIETSTQEIQIWDVTGKIIFSEKNYGGNIKIDVSSFVEGIYFVRKGHQVRKLVICR